MSDDVIAHDLDALEAELRSSKGVAVVLDSESALKLVAMVRAAQQRVAFINAAYVDACKREEEASTRGIALEAEVFSLRLDLNSERQRR